MGEMGDGESVCVFGKMFVHGVHDCAMESQTDFFHLDIVEMILTQNGSLTWRRSSQNHSKPPPQLIP